MRITRRSPVLKMPLQRTVSFPFLLAILLATSGVASAEISQPAQTTARRQRDLRASWGKANCIVVGKALKVYGLVRGERIPVEELVMPLKRRQAIEVDIEVERFLSQPGSQAGEAPRVITARVFSVPISGIHLAVALENQRLVFLLKHKDSNRDPYYYPANEANWYVGPADGEFIQRLCAIKEKNTPRAPDLAGYYRVPGAHYLVRQESNNDCWLACVLMLLSWRDQLAWKRESALALLSLPTNAAVKRGLLPREKPFINDRLKLKAEAPQTFTGEGWKSLLQEQDHCGSR